MPNDWNSKIWIMLPCKHEWIEESQVEFVDICEDFEGRDLLTYKCPVCHKIHKSLRCGR